MDFSKALNRKILSIDRLGMFFTFPGPSKSSNIEKKEPINPPPLPDQMNGSSNVNLSSNNGSTPGLGKNDNSSRFTTSNFVESVITPSESVFAEMQKNKKRKTNEQLPSPLSNTSNIVESEKNFSKFGNPEEENDDDEDDDDSGTLNFMEEPNLSTLKTENAVSAAKISTTFNLLTTSSKKADFLG